MTATVFVSVVAVAAIGVALFYRSANRLADQTISKLNDELRKVKKWHDDIMRQDLATTTKERDALAAELKVQERGIKTYISDAIEAERLIRQHLDGIKSIANRMAELWRDDPDETLGNIVWRKRQERVSAETDEQPDKRNAIPLSQFTEAVEAAGLTVDRDRDAWIIKSAGSPVATD